MEGLTYMVLVDTYSKWPEVVQMETIFTKNTKKELNKIFSKVGYPGTSVSDNGTQFTAD